MSEFKMPIRPQESNKGTFGKILNFAGSDNYIGAAFLSTLSSYKVGAGLVALSSTSKVIDSVSKLLPETVYLTREDGIKNIEKYTVYLIGCGFGQTRNSKNDFFKIIKKLQNTSKPVIIDADGLNILSNTKIILPPNTIITPHPTEASRLLGGVNVDQILKDTQTYAKELSAKYNCVVVLKTHNTIICQKENVYINKHGNSALAKAGTGDVLAGVIAGLCAQNCLPFDAAKLGVYLHSRAGEIASSNLTEYSVMASDVINYLPNAIKEI